MRAVVMGTTSIQWTDRTVNPIRARNRETGAVGHFCEKVSPGCTHCYASTWNERVRPSGKHLIGTGLAFDARNREKVEMFFDGSRLIEVLQRRAPTKWFWCDMTDMFGEWVPDAWLDVSIATMALAEHHTHQLLTKRAERLPVYFNGLRERAKGRFFLPALFENAAVLIERDDASIQGIEEGQRGWLANRFYRAANEHAGQDKWPIPNLWLGVSCEDQPQADERIAELVNTPAALRFLSCEPLLSEIYLRLDGHFTRDFIDWVIVGGESGHGARPCDLAWVRSIVEQCKAAGVACFVKQLGAKARDGHKVYSVNPAVEWSRFLMLRSRKGGDPSEWPADLRVRQFPEVTHGNL